MYQSHSGAAHIGADHSGILQSRHNRTMSRMPWAKGCSACPACGTEMTVPVGRCYLYDLILSCLDHCVRVSLMASCMWSLRCHTTKTNLQQFARTCRIPINLPHGYQYAKHGNTVSRIGGESWMQPKSSGTSLETIKSCRHLDCFHQASKGRIGQGLFPNPT